MTGSEIVLIAVAAVAAGAVNALAGGGTLITFPTLLAMGIPPVVANVTNTVALSPGYAGGAVAQRRDLTGQAGRLAVLVPAAIAGGIAGGVLLLATGERIFSALVPYLILLASGLLAIQEPLRRRLAAGGAGPSRGTSRSGVTAALLVFAASVYGGYFGAGLSVILLAMLGLCFEERLPRLNATKHVVALAANLAAAVLFMATGRVLWQVAVVMAAGAIAGGMLGGRAARRMPERALRRVVVATGVVVGVMYLVKG